MLHYFDSNSRHLLRTSACSDVDPGHDCCHGDSAQHHCQSKFRISSVNFLTFQKTMFIGLSDLLIPNASTPSDSQSLHIQVCIFNRCSLLNTLICYEECNCNFTVLLEILQVIWRFQSEEHVYIVEWVFTQIVFTIIFVADQQGNDKAVNHSSNSIPPVLRFRRKKSPSHGHRDINQCAVQDVNFFYPINILMALEE